MDWTFFFADLDECKMGLANCTVNSLCKNKPGSFDCECQAGYKLENKTCVDINECKDKKDNLCAAEAECTNKEPMYSCACKKGYIGNGFQCVSKNPCERNITCQKNATCTVFDNDRPQCVCDAGFIPKGTKCEGKDAETQQPTNFYACKLGSAFLRCSGERMRSWPP